MIVRKIADAIIISAVTNEDLVDWGAKAGVKFTF